MEVKRTRARSVFCPEGPVVDLCNHTGPKKFQRCTIDNLLWGVRSLNIREAELVALFCVAQNTVKCP